MVELRGEITVLKSTPDGEAKMILSLRNEVQTLTARNKALTTVIKQAQDLSQDVSISVPSSSASDTTFTENCALTAKMRLWEERLTSLSPPVLGNLFHRIYSKAFHGQLSIGEVRGMITQTHQLYHQNMSTVPSIFSAPFANTRRLLAGGAKSYRWWRRESLLSTAEDPVDYEE